MLYLADLILSFIALIFSLVFLLIPVRAGLFIGRCFGTLAYYLNIKRKRVAYANMKAAFKGERSPEEIDSLIKKMYQNFGQVIVEVFTLPRVNKRYVSEYIEVKNMDRIDKALSKKKGVIFLTAHFGNWEITSITSAIIGYPLSVLAREQKMKALNGLLNFYRQIKGCKVVKKGMATREIFKDLRENKLIGVLSDQDAGRRGVFVDFFGRPTSFAAGVVNLAESTGAVILPTFIVREKGPKHTIYIEEPLEITNTGKKFADESVNLTKYSNILESYIRRFPDQWLWVHKRWKSTPLKTIIILSDGKQGHLNQSRSIAEKIMKLRFEKGYKVSDTPVKELDIKFKNNLRKNMFICLSMALFYKIPRVALKFALTADSYKNLVNTYGDIIISTGSSMVPVNIFAKSDNNARNIASMDPGFMARSHFNLLIIPKHDLVKESHRVVVTKGTTNLISKDLLEESKNKILQLVQPGDSINVGVIIGGSNDSFVINNEIINKVLDEVTDFCEKNSARILLTTSRRTSKEVEDTIKKRLTGNKYCKFLVIANEKNYDFALSGIMGISDIIVVSGDSSSMVSEAISSGKKVLVFEPLVIKSGSKHLSMLKDLSSEGNIVFTGPEKIAEFSDKLLKQIITLKPLDDNVKVLKAVERFV